MPHRRRYQIVEMDLRVFVRLFQIGQEIDYKVASGLPADAVIDAAEYDMTRDVMKFRVYSSEYPALKNGDVIPTTLISLEKVHRPEVPPQSAARQHRQ